MVEPQPHLGCCPLRLAGAGMRGRGPLSMRLVLLLHWRPALQCLISDMVDSRLSNWQWEGTRN